MKINILFLISISVFFCSCSDTNSTKKESSTNSASSGGSRDLIGSETEKKQKESFNFEITIGKAAGDITASSNEADLITLYGDKNVNRDTVWQGEGFYEIGTCIFKNTPNEIRITWSDTAEFSKPQTIYIRQEGSKWKTSEGIGIGTSLKELEKINAGEFTMTGFGWDYAGTVIEWRNGKMQSKSGHHNDHFLIRLGEPEPLGIPDEDYQKLLGDLSLKSSDPLLQKMNPRVNEMILILNR